MEYADKNKVEESYRDTCESISELTGYPYKLVDGVLKSLQLYIIDGIADEVIESDRKPETISFPIPSIGEIRFSRDLRSKDGDVHFEFIPTEEFCNQFRDAFFYGKTILLKVMKSNFDSDLAKFDESNLLRLESLL